MTTTNSAPEGRVRILVVAETFPWPAVSGYQRRLASVIGALSAIGAVDLWTAALGPHVGTADAPDDVTIARARVSSGVRRRGVPERVLRWLTGRLPRGQVEFDARKARADLVAWAAPSYDLVWCGHLRTFLWTRKVVHGPVVLDLDDLADALLAHRREMLRATNRGRQQWVPRTIAARVGDLIDQERYRRLERRVARRVTTVAVCSELDRARLHADNAAVVPNTYPAPEPPATLHAPNLDAPCFLMVGLLAYGPNRDGARFFVHEVFPRVRAALPGARLRLVGRRGGELDDLADTPGVELVGEVPDIGPELRSADAIVVPLRYGGGTRVKVLEAFAYRVPVVSTNVGCEGLDTRAGTHLLVADDPVGLANACISVVQDPALRVALTDAAFALFHERFRPEAAQRAITEIVRGVLPGGPASVADAS